MDNIKNLLLLARYLNVNKIDDIKATMCPKSPLASKSLITTEQKNLFGTKKTKLGKGVSGVVWKTTKDYAYKYIENTADSLREISIMQYLDHSNLTCISGMFKKSQQYVIVREVANVGTLFDVFFDLKKSETLRKEAYYQIFSGLAYLHSVFIVHGDIKPKNILVFKQGTNYTYKITDFGLSTSCTYLPLKRSAHFVTPLWRAPEVYKQIKAAGPSGTPTMIVDGKIDIWAVGIIMFDIIYQNDKHKSIYIGSDPDEIYDHILKDIRLKTDNNTKMPEDEGKLIELCLTVDPTKRPIALECLNHKYFDNIRQTKDIIAITENNKSVPQPIKPYENRDKVVKYIVKKVNGELDNIIIKSLGVSVDIFNAAVIFYTVALMDIYMLTETQKINDVFDENESDIYDTFMLTKYSIDLEDKENKRFIELTLKTSLTNDEEQELKIFEDSSDIDILHFMKKITMFKEKAKTSKMYSRLSNVKTVDEYIEKFNQIKDKLNLNMPIANVINVIVKISVDFIIRDISIDYTTLQMFDKVLNVLINTMYVPTALQYYVHLHSKLPSNETLEIMLAELVDNPDQASIVKKLKE